MQSSRGSDAGEQHPSHGAEPAGREPGAREDEQRQAPNAEGAAVAGDAGGNAGASLSEELARIEDRYKRALADLDNYRKRATREVDRRVAEAREAALRDWLQVVDSVERAMRMEP